ncbi:hypothetical protein PV409_37820 [Streptomyces sp. ME02-6979.5a]|uniref:hypothetical protein n=1 Tax=unclassified Streptomyces TaxID=2593676 RepID=UPI0029A69E9F|nr:MULTISPECIES: hypothetical protein [unclassified Streptomyces]MDX3343712.1 hypothetical protein [Streptomyces sp. ME02-6979.5a]MDX5526180.1 hypothetical protein [Streptomyces sp. DE06-01C]
MATRLTFLLDGRDQLSRVLDRAGDSANRMHRRISAAATNSSDSINRLGRTTTDRMAAMQRDTGLGAKAVDKLKGALLSLAPAAIPMVASLAPIAPAVGAAAVAAGAYAAALGPQIGAMSEAAEAEKKYTDEVKKSGRTSEAAVAAQLEYQRTLADMPPATRRAAASLSVLKDEYADWSDGLAADTLAPVNKSFAILNGLLPKTSGLVKGTSRELDRTMTILAGGMQSPGLDQLNQRFERFATGTLRKVNNALVDLMRTSDTGKVAGGMSEFMEYARANGPAAADTVKQLGQALLNVLEAGSDVGVGLLQVVNVLAKLVASVPPEAIATMLQLAFAIKAVQLAAVGMAAARTAVAGFATSLVAMRVAAAGAPGRLAAVTAAIGTMSRGAKLAAAGTGIGLLVIALMELNQIGRDAPPDVDKMTSSLARFADSGKVAGEMARVFGKDLSGLVATLNVMGSTGKGADFFAAFEKSPVNLKEAKREFEALDKSLASLVSNGKADLAAAGLARIKEQMATAGHSTAGLKDRLTEYKEALAAAAFEEQLAADAMGLFGQQALAVQTKLDAQKASADGLRQSIQALNDQHRAGLGGMIGFEAAIDSATAAIKGNEEALSMSGGQLNLNSEKARTAATALNDLAAKTDEAAAQARQSGASWSTVNGIYAKGRAALIRSADAMGLNRNEAKALADQILQTPNKTAKLKGNLEDLEGKLATAKAKLKSVPDSRQAKVRAEISDLQRKVGQARYELSRLGNKSVTITTRYVTVGDSSAARRSGSHGSQLKYAAGGLVGFPSGGMVSGPGTGTSDSILARVSNGEFVVKAKSVAKYGARFLAAINEGRLGMASTMSGAGGSMAGAGVEAGRGLSAGLRASAAGVDGSARVMAAAVTAGVSAELEIASPSKKMKALMKDVGKGLILGMTGEKAKISATAKDLVKDIWAAWKGVKTNKDSALVAMVNRDTKKLQSLATARDKVASKIAAANKYRSDLYRGAQQAAGLSSLGLQDEEVSASSIQSGLAQKLNKINQFTRYVASLAKKGLNKNLIKQVLDMGPDQGYPYASALAGMSSSALKAVNSTQSQLDKAAANLGGLGADVMYDSGKNSGKGYLAGLQSQQKAIEAQMLKIAKGMDKAIRKALGIKSPSTVMAQLGRYTTEGLAVGMRQRLPVLDQALAAVSDRVTGMRPVVGRPAVAGAGGRVYNVTVTVEQAMDPVAVGREIERVMNRFGRAQGR